MRKSRFFFGRSFRASKTMTSKRFFDLFKIKQMNPSDFDFNNCALMWSLRHILSFFWSSSKSGDILQKLIFVLRDLLCYNNSFWVKTNINKNFHPCLISGANGILIGPEEDEKFSKWKMDVWSKSVKRNLQNNYPKPP